MFRNVAGQGVYLSASDGSGPKAGDAANITGHVSLDGGATASFATAHPTEVGGGTYWQPLSQAETDGAEVAFYWSSSTSGVKVDPATRTTGVQLADGVAHGGTPGSSTATFAGRRLVLSSDTTDPALGILNTGIGNAVKINSDGGFGLEIYGSAGAFDVSSNGTAPTVGIYGGSTASAIGIYGPYSIAGPAVYIDTTAGVSGVDGGPGLSIVSGAGRAVDIRAGGDGNSAVALAPGSGGYGLDATLSPGALDAISVSAPTGPAATFREMVVMTYRRFFAKSAKAASGHTITNYADDGTTAVTTQSYTDDGAGNQTLGASS